MKGPQINISITNCFYTGAWISSYFVQLDVLWASLIQYIQSRACYFVSFCHSYFAEFSVPVNTILILLGDRAWRDPTPPQCITRCLLAIPRTQHVHEFPQVFTDAVLLGMLLVFIFQVPAQMLTHWWGSLPINYDFLSAFIGLPFCYDTYFTLGPCIH